MDTCSGGNKREPDEPRRVIFSSPTCHVETHPVYGLIITGELTAVDLDGEVVIIPARC